MREKSTTQQNQQQLKADTEEDIVGHSDVEKVKNAKTAKKSSKNASSNASSATKLNANGAPKRQKIVKACRDCRRRKVKCDGGTPCGTCRRSSIPCIFEASSPKKANSSNNSGSGSSTTAGAAGLVATTAATKHYIESLENKINVIERALNSLGEPTIQLVEEAMRKQQLYTDNKNTITNVQQGKIRSAACSYIVYVHAY
ncbi:hypothetical protein BDF20DRAFT_368004 [Mycotypha africana]|uniref:uncharacterized protein n=1 Tax=Mycotypha africana TaxID=64632 RepID=UPI00230027D4|nr:uncharacterized protein BDF20DRAFT_368004 [Mycotypha africana]KAI8984136.1 hypothetical protein BDF20DRAFT_368004 [Mycotypha africana]